MLLCTLQVGKQQNHSSRATSSLNPSEQQQNASAANGYTDRGPQEKPHYWVCEICNATFRSYCGFNKHRKNQHLGNSYNSWHTIEFPSSTNLPLSYFMMQKKVYALKPRLVTPTLVYEIEFHILRSCRLDH